MATCLCSSLSESLVLEVALYRTFTLSILFKSVSSPPPFPFAVTRTAPSPCPTTPRTR